MNEFDITRFINVAKWDLTINRQFYRKAALIILLIMALPALGSLLRFVYLEPVDYNFFLCEPTASVAISTVNCYFAMPPILAGYMLHNLRNRQGRINELTLPATNAEKYVWHTCLTLFGSLCVAVVSFFLIDLLYNLCLGLLAGFSNSEEFIASMLSYSMFPGFDIFEDDEWAYIALPPYLLFLSTFVLGNAWKYRHNVVLTIAWDIALLFAIILMIGIVFWLIMLHVLEENGTAVRRMADFIDSSACEVLIFIVELCLILACWAWAYHLYTKATITSRRNR